MGYESESTKSCHFFYILTKNIPIEIKYLCRVPPSTCDVIKSKHKLGLPNYLTGPTDSDMKTHVNYIYPSVVCGSHLSCQHLAFAFTKLFAFRQPRLITDTLVALLHITTLLKLFIHVDCRRRRKNFFCGFSRNTFRMIFRTTNLELKPGHRPQTDCSTDIQTVYGFNVSFKLSLSSKNGRRGHNHSNR